MPRIRQIVRLQVECGYANVSLIPKPTCADINADGNEIDSFDCADDPNEMLLPETAEEQAAITCADWTCEYSECCTRAPPPPPRTCGDPDADGVANPFDCSTSPTRSALLATLVRHMNPFSVVIRVTGVSDGSRLGGCAGELVRGGGRMHGRDLLHHAATAARARAGARAGTRLLPRSPCDKP